MTATFELDPGRLCNPCLLNRYSTADGKAKEFLEFCVNEGLKRLSDGYNPEDVVRLSLDLVDANVKRSGGDVSTFGNRDLSETAAYCAVRKYEGRCDTEETK